MSQQWDQRTIDALNAHQRDGRYHPYTCGNGCRTSVLVATPDGWVCPEPGCGYTQKWAHGAPDIRPADHKG